MHFRWRGKKGKHSNHFHHGFFVVPLVVSTFGHLRPDFFAGSMSPLWAAGLFVTIQVRTNTQTHTGSMKHIELLIVSWSLGHIATVVLVGQPEDA